MNKTPMTAQGAQRLREELARRKTEDRPRITQAIAEARAHGDLKENAEYAAAREQQSFNEGRIADIESKLSNAEIIDVTKLNAGGKVVFGATVEIMNLETDPGRAGALLDSARANLERATELNPTLAPAFATLSHLYYQAGSLVQVNMAAKQAYEKAGSGPDDLNLVELHDCFATAELVHYDNLMLCPEGGATLAAWRRAVEEGWISADDEAVLFNCATGLKYPLADKAGWLDKAALPDLATL